MGWGGDRVGDRRGWDGREGFTIVRDWDFLLLAVVKGEGDEGVTAVTGGMV